MSDELIFAEESPSQQEPEGGLRWKILVADDEQAVHLVTKLALQDFVFEGRKLEILSAHNEQETRDQMKAHPDTALILLDVVMDTVNSGFDLVKYIREDLRNRDVRIVMRTGQSGNAPEDRVIIDYDINDFKDKTELTVSKLRTTIISSLRNLSHLKKLAESRSYMDQLLNTLPALMITLNHNAEVVLWNHTAQDWLQIPQAEARGRTLWGLTPVFEPLKAVILESLKNRTSFEQTGVPFLAGGNRRVNLALYPLSLGHHNQLIIRMDDASGNLRMEKQYRSTRRLEAMTELGGGFSREMEKILRLAEEGLKDDNPREALTAISQESSALLKDLKALGKTQENRRSEVDLPQEVRLVLDSLPPHIKIITEIAGDLKPVSANRDDLFMAITQVVSNSLEALESQKNPQLSVSLQRVVPDKLVLLEHPEAEDRHYLKFSITDNGPGISQEILDRVFEPYVTTRKDHRGLGLSRVYRIMTLGGGFVTVDSEQGQGTKVCLYWPANPSPEAIKINKPFQGDGTILVCDDEPMMRQLACSILQRYGFKTLQAEDGPKALKVFQENSSAITLVLMDVLMPGMNGLELFRGLKKLYPGVKVLLSSGFGFTDQVETALAEGCAGFLQKPYGHEKLGKKIAEILG